MADLDLLDDLADDLLQVAGRSRGTSSRKRSRSKRAGDSDNEDENLFGSDSEGDDNDKSTKRGKGSSGGKKARGGRDDEDDDGYGSDLYIDEEDRRQLEAMNELQREMILAERAEKRDQARQRKQLLNKTKVTEPDSVGKRSSSRQKRGASEKETAIKRIEAARKRQQKGKAGESDEDEDRRETAGKAGRGARDWSESDEERSDKSEEDEDFRADEEEEEEEEERGRDNKGAGARGRRSEDEEEEELSRGSEDEEEAAAAQRGREAEETRGREVRRETYRDVDDMDEEDESSQPADKDELRGIQLTRTQLEAMWDKPYFDGDGLNGAVVRMAYGGSTYDHATQSHVPQYMLMMITGISTNSSRSYPFGQRSAACNKYLVLMDGVKVVRTMAMQNVSNSPLTDGEVERYWRHCDRAPQTPISKQQAAEAKAKINEALNFRWDSSKVQEMIERKRAAGRMPVNIAQEKSRLRSLLEEAQAKGDVDAVADCEGQLRELDVKSLAKGDSGRTYGMSHINKRNQQANFNIAFRNVSNKPAGATERKGGVDPFSRRATRPNIYWNTGGAGNGAAGEQAAAAAAAAAAKLSEHQKLGKGMAKMDPSELIKLLDIDIDVRQLQQYSIAPPLARRLLGPKWQQSLIRHSEADLAGKTLLTIADWKRRAGYM